MSNPAPEERSGREIRLLMLVIVIAVAGLLVLARFRFPTAEIVTVSPTPTALERLTVRAPFEDLANAVAAAAARVRPVVAVVEVEIEPPEAPAARPSGQAAASVEPVPAPRLLGLALRVAPGRLLMYMAGGARPVSAGGEPVQVIGEDASREIVLVTTSPAEGLSVEVVDFVGAVPSFGGSSYVLAVEAAAGGPVSRPVFIARVDPAAAEGWETPLLKVGGTPPVPAGVFLFTIDGRLVGLTIPQETGIAIVGAAALDRLAGQLVQAEAGAPAEPEVPGGGK
jgi:hypothetical protein